MAVDLATLETALAAALAAHPAVTTSRLEGNVVHLILESTQIAPYRTLRIAASELPGRGPVYWMRWTQWNPSARTDDAEGTAWGDLAFTLRAVEHWLFERRASHEVPEFRPDALE
jgi:hypothetical protein